MTKYGTMHSDKSLRSDSYSFNHKVAYTKSLLTDELSQVTACFDTPLNLRLNHRTHERPAPTSESPYSRMQHKPKATEKEP